MGTLKRDVLHAQMHNSFARQVMVVQFVLLRTMMPFASPIFLMPEAAPVTAFNRRSKKRATARGRSDRRPLHARQKR